MPRDTMSLWVGGAAGDGIASTGETFIKLCARSGLHAFAYNSYQSVIRGGHVLFQAAAGPAKQYTQADDCDLLVALNQDTLNREAGDARCGVLYNSDRFKLEEGRLRSGAQAFGLPVMKLSSNPLAQNMVALGALVQLVGLPFEALAQLTRETFKGKSQEVREGNVSAARAGYEYAAQGFAPIDIRLSASNRRYLLMTGNQAFGLGALAAGCKFYSAYPMTPASSILHYLVPRAPKYGMVVKQGEDEIAVMNMAIGAGNAGVRSMCATSGGGFALMTEAVGQAAMVEAPVVVINVQRGGPSTGLPTKTEQGDLFQVFGASQGDFPKCILAPLDVADAFYTAAEAFNLAERYQVPVMILSDLLLSEHQETIDALDLNVEIDRGVWAKTPANGDGSEFKRYLDTDTGVSPRAIPGQEGLIFTAGTDEHDERGHLISDVATDPAKRNQMMRKRMRKMDYLARELRPPVLMGPQDAELTLVGWGSSFNMMKLMMNHFNADGANRINILPLRTICPFPWKEVSEMLYKARKVMILEANYSAQMARFIRMETGYYIPHRWLKYDGEPFYPGSTAQRIKEVLES